jgi:hypothetical protein
MARATSRRKSFDNSPGGEGGEAKQAQTGYENCQPGEYREERGGALVGTVFGRKCAINKVVVERRGWEELVPDALCVGQRLFGSLFLHPQVIGFQEGLIEEECHGFNGLMERCEVEVIYNADYL